MALVTVSADLLSLVQEKSRNINYYITEHLGYLSEENCQRLKNAVTIAFENAKQVELPDDTIEELMDNFDPDTDISQAVNMVLLCTFMYGGV